MSLRFARSKIHGIVTNYHRPRTPRGLKKGAPRLGRGALASCYGTIYPLRLDRLGQQRRYWRIRTATGPAYFADLEARETPDRNVLAQLGDRLGNHLANRYALVFNVVLFVEAVFLVELFHLAGHDFLDHRFRLSGCQRLRAVNLALFFEHLRRYFLAPHIARIQRRHVHGDIVRKLLERIRARHEIGFAVQFHEHTNLAARVNVAAHEPFAGLALRFLRRGRLAFFAKNLDSFLDVSIGFDKRCSTIAETSSCSLTKFFHKLGWNFHSCLLCTHPFSLLFLFADLSFLIQWPCLQNRPPRCARSGPQAFPTRADCLLPFLIRRDGRLGGFRRDFRWDFDEVAFLFLVLLVSAGVHVLHAVYQSLVLRRFLFGHLRLLVRVVAFEHGIRNLRRKQTDRTQSVVVSRDDPVDHIRVAIRIHDRNHRYSHAPRFLHRNLFRVGIDHEHGVRQLDHVLDAFEILEQVLHLAVQPRLFFLGKLFNAPVFVHGLQQLQPLDGLLERRPIRQRSAQPPVVHEKRAAALGLFGDRFLGLPFGAHKENVSALCGEFADEAARFAE